jgi:hypothetical protein
VVFESTLNYAECGVARVFGTEVLEHFLRIENQIVNIFRIVHEGISTICLISVILQVKPSANQQFPLFKYATKIIYNSS